MSGFYPFNEKLLSVGCIGLSMPRRLRGLWGHWLHIWDNVACQDL